MANENLAYREEWPEELIDGEVMAMSPATPNHTIAGRSCDAFSMQPVR